jgi:thioesterase domain-containing protein
MPRELASQLLARAGSVWNMYGPTETTIWSTLHRVGRGEGPVSVGAPIDNTPVYVLDGHGELQPFGVPGELFIGGAGVARGYLHRRELTAARFVADPFAGGNARMYRTGDAACLRPDGTLDYHGRLDHQVKIRGHRIELGEIEAVLREHPHVAGVVVVAREFAPGDVRLVGYYVPREPGVTARELRELCQRKLPKDVVPTAWMALTAIPLTPNGKTDTRALPAPDPNTHDDDVERVPPRDALEAQLASIWEAVLETKIHSVRDRFFDIGGHSLLAIRLFARIEQATGVALPLASLVEGGTIEHMATSIRERRLATNADNQQKSLSYLVPIRAQGSRAPLFCVHGAGGNVLNFRDIGRHLSPDRPFYGIQAAGVDGTTRPLATVEEMAENYLEEVRSIQPRGPYYLSGYCGGGIVAYEIAQRLLAAGEEVALLVLIDVARPGYMVIEGRRQRWSRTLAEESVPLLLKRAVAKFTREFANTVENLRIRYHLSRGIRMPFELRERWLIECFLQAIFRYQLLPYPGRITLLRAREAGSGLGQPGEDLGWGTLARDGVESHEVPGDHHSLTLEPNVQVLAAQLEACIRAAESDGAPASVIDNRPRRGVAA